MLCEFAVEPDALSRWNPLWQALEQFGVAHGRMISQFPKKWQRLVYEATAACSPLERKALEVRLQQLSAKLMASRRTYDSGQSWRQNALLQMSLAPFHAIIQSDNPTAIEFVLTAIDLHVATPRWNVASERNVPRRAADLAACISGLCQMSKELIMVDPHFTTDRRFTEVLQEFVRIALGDGRRFDRIEFHTSSRIAKSILESGATQWIAPRVPRGVTVRFLQWKERTPGEKLHARYVLTERGGIRFDVGLDSGEPGQTTDVSLLSDLLFRQRWADFQRPTAAFDFAGEFVITGTR